MTRARRARGYVSPGLRGGRATFSNRQPRARALVVGVAAAAVALGACGGGGSSKSSSPTTDAANVDATGTTASGNGGAKGDCYTKPGEQHARVRFVNLFTNATYPSSDIDVYQGYSADDPCGKKLATVAFGQASDYVDVTASDTSGGWATTAYVAGSPTKDHQVMNQTETWKGGEQVTIIFQGGEPDPSSGLPPSAGGDQAHFEKGGSDTSAFTPESGKALLAIGAASLQYVVKDGTWRAGVAGRSGCLKTADDTDSVAANVGGTSLLSYSVDPGPLDVALYPATPATCTGTPEIGPVSVDAPAGSATLVLAYGADAQHLKLLVLPIDN